MMRPLIVLATTLAFTAAAPAEQGWYQQPTLHDNTIVFVSEGDLWTCTLPETIVADAPISAYRLTSGDGTESHPRFNIAGTHIAFAAQYDGNTDTYTMPVTGGPPHRLTFHAGDDIPLAWTPDGSQLLFRSSRAQPLGRAELYRISLAGGTPQREPFGECSMIALSTTGTRFAFTRWSNENWSWKGYRGGTAPEIWLGDTDAETFAPLTDNDASDLFPIWIAGRIFFLSDRDGAFNLYSNRFGGGDLKQRTHFAADSDNATAIEGYDLRWPSGDTQRRGARIIFCQAGGLALYNTRDDSITRLNIHLAGDRASTRARLVSASDGISEFDLSPNGDRLVLGVRGELAIHDLATGVTQQITHTSGARERGASFTSSDELILLTDITGEQQIATMPADGSSTPGLVTDDRHAWLFPPVRSNDGRWVAFADHTMRLQAIDMVPIVPQLVDRAAGSEITDYRFSPDGTWLAYTREEDNGQSQVYLHALETSRSFRVSDGRSNDSEPRWDPAGMYLYFLSDRHFAPTFDGADFNAAFIDMTQIAVVPLAAGTPPPLPAIARAADFDLSEWAMPLGGDDDLFIDFIEPMMIDTEGIELRRTLLPIPPGTYSSLEATYGGVLFIKSSPSDDDEAAGALLKFSPTDDEPKVIAEETDDYVLSRNGAVVAWKTKAGITVKPLAGGEPTTVSGKTIQVLIDVRAEWGQILDEAWRLQRDFFWAPNYHGVDWDDMQTKYRALLPRIGTRTELTQLIGSMIGELRCSHTYVWGGNQHPHQQANKVSVGALGIDIAWNGPAAEITRILQRHDWHPMLDSPLDRPHLPVKVGDMLLAINETPLTFGTNQHALLQGEAGKWVTLTVADDARGANTRRIRVKTLPSERLLRYMNWVETNRSAAAAQSEERIGYVHIPDMGRNGLSMFARQFYEQFDQPALIIDARNNGGGFVSQIIIERLARRVLAYAQPRHGRTSTYPDYAPRAHLVVLIDQHAGSDGDIFATITRQLELAPLIGTRTWGGVVGIRGDKSFIDQGMSTQPEFAWRDANGWSIENHGVDPDVEVIITPTDRRNGDDPQLAAAIEYLLKKLADDPRETPAPPPLPVRTP